MNVNLEYYKIFYYVGKYESITQAAEALAISQPAVSQAVKNLEKNLGSALFVRTSKGVRLTVEGKLLYSYVQRGYEYILLGERKFQEMQDRSLNAFNKTSLLTPEKLTLTICGARLSRHSSPSTVSSQPFTVMPSS